MIGKAEEFIPQLLVCQISQAVDMHACPVASRHPLAVFAEARSKMLMGSFSQEANECMPATLPPAFLDIAGGPGQV